MTTTTTFVIKTRSTAPFALIGFHHGVPYLIGYAHSKGPAVLARARRERARILPIEHARGRVLVEVEA